MKRVLMLAAAPGFVIAVFLALFASGAVQASTFVNQASPTAQKPLPAIQRPKDTLVVGSEQDYPPFATGMTDATAGGFTVDLWKAVAAETGLNYTIRVRPFHQLLQEFKDGKIDVLINLAQSDKRRQFADFTVPHVIVYGAIFVRKGGSDIHAEEDLAGKSIIVLKADLAHDYAVSKGWEKQLVLVDTSAEGLRLLASGKHDAMLLSKLAGMQVLQALGPTNIEAPKVKAGFSQKFAFAVEKGQSELLGKLNEGLALTKSSGTYNLLYDKWFGIYEVKEAGPRDVLKYIVPIVVSFLVIATYFFYRRQVERKQAGTALKESEERFRLVVESTPQCIVMTDSDGRIEFLNPQTERTFGYRREELIGRNIDALVPERYRAGHVRVRTEFLAAPTVRNMGTGRDLFGLRRDGTEVPVEIGLSPLRIRGRSYVLASIVDITERKLAREAVERTNHMRSEFMANVTHELRTPLNSVIGFAELLKDEVPGPLNAKQAAFAADILASGQRLLALVEGILEMSRLDAAGHALECEPVEIGAALEERLAVHRKAAEAGRISIAVEVAADAGRVDLDPKALRRMLDALLDNAIKFNREDGTVVVSARRDDEWLEIAVEDTGIGIAPADLSKLFKPLTQLDAGLARRHGGVGLGLVLARRLAELHGGTIEVESEPGKGSRFTLRFPIHDLGQVLH
jgi:PAS domain S-box-containing protein